MKLDQLVDIVMGNIFRNVLNDWQDWGLIPDPLPTSKTISQ